MGLMFQAQFRSKYKPSKYKYKRVYNYLAEVLGVARGIKKKIILFVFDEKNLFKTFLIAFVTPRALMGPPPKKKMSAHWFQPFGSPAIAYI